MKDKTQVVSADVVGYLLLEKRADDEVRLNCIDSGPNDYNLRFLSLCYSVYTNFCLFLFQLFHPSAKWSRFFWNSTGEKTGGKRGRGGREHGNGSFKTVIYEIIFFFFCNLLNCLSAIIVNTIWIIVFKIFLKENFKRAPISWFDDRVLSYENNFFKVYFI